MCFKILECTLILVTIAYVSGQNNFELKVVAEKLTNTIRTSEKLIKKEDFDLTSKKHGFIERNLLSYDPNQTEGPVILKIKYILNKVKS